MEILPAHTNYTSADGRQRLRRVYNLADMSPEGEQGEEGGNKNKEEEIKNEEEKDHTYVTNI